MAKAWALFTATAYEGYDFRGIFDSELAAVDAGNKIVENMSIEDSFDWCYTVEIESGKDIGRNVNSIDATFIYDKNEEA